MWFPNRSDTNRPVQLQKWARSLIFWSLVEEELYYPSSENKGADQLRGYREADLRLCFRLCRLLVFPWGGSIITILPKINASLFILLSFESIIICVERANIPKLQTQVEEYFEKISADESVLSYWKDGNVN